MISALRYSLALVAFLGFSAHAEEQRSIADGVYTEEQAAAGEELYKVHCLTCHDKRYFRPVLRRWNGQPIDMLYMIMSTSMPESNPASLRQEEYIEILAYILSLSRYPDGDTPLDYKDDALKKVIVEPRKR